MSALKTNQNKEAAARQPGNAAIPAALPNAAKYCGICFKYSILIRMIYDFFFLPITRTPPPMMTATTITAAKIQISAALSPVPGEWVSP